MTKRQNKCPCGCGGRYKAGGHDYKIDADNVAGLENPWNKKPTKEDLKICKLCSFEARNGHAHNSLNDTRACERCFKKLIGIKEPEPTQVALEI